MKPSQSMVLASKSASRRAMLEAAGVPFTFVPPDVDERGIEAALPSGTSPAGVALALAQAKALAISAQAPGQLVLGSDSLVVCEGRRFDKPETVEAAAEHLRFFSGKTLSLHSAAVLVRDGQVVRRDADLASLHVNTLSDPFIADYLHHEWPAVSGCVGVFRIEGRGVQLFRAIEGDHFTILGMPLLAVLQFLRELDVLAQ